MNDDKVEGWGRKAEGTVQEAFGTVTGNKSQQAKGTAKKILGDAQNAFGKAEDCIRDSYETVESHVKEKPVQSALVALGVGFLIGRLLGL